MTTFENAKVGDKVWDFVHGWGEIINITANMNYPLKVKFDSSGYIITFSYIGNSNDDESQTLFWNEFKIPDEAFIKTLHKLEVDTKVLVWDTDECTKQRRYFSNFDKLDRICVFANGATSWSTKSTVRYSNWKLEDNDK